MKKQKPKPWFYWYDGVDFGGFTQEPMQTLSTNGPFKTLAQARSDALQFFQFYVDKGRQAQREIRKDAKKLGFE